MATSFETTNVVWRIDQSYAATAEKIINWLRQLMDLTQKSDKEVNKNFVTNLTIMLMGKFEKWYFTVGSLEYVASQSKFFPTYRELCDHLSAWIELEKYRRSNQNITATYCNHSDFLTLTSEAKGWVGNFYLRQSHHWREEPQEPLPSLDVQSHRAATFKHMMKQYCVVAYDYLFSEEAKEERHGDSSNAWENLMRDVQHYPEGPIKNALIQWLKNGVEK